VLFRSQKFDTRMWNMKNEYDSPDQQMIRLKEAGLNPNLIYCSGGATSLSAPPVKTQAMSAPAPLAGVHLPDILSIIQTVSEVEKNRAETQLKNSKRDFTDMNTKYVGTNKDYKDILINYGEPQFRAGMIKNSWQIQNDTWEEQKALIQNQLRKSGIELDSMQIDKRMKELNLNQNEKLKEFNLNMNDDIISRLLVHIINKFR